MPPIMKIRSSIRFKECPQSSKISEFFIFMVL